MLNCVARSLPHPSSDGQHAVLPEPEPIAPAILVTLGSSAGSAESRSQRYPGRVSSDPALPALAPMPAATPPGEAVRFAVLAGDGARSATWRVWTGRHTRDVYFTARGMRGTWKTSLHESGNWQHGLTAEFQQLQGEIATTRHFDIWQRPPDSPQELFEPSHWSSRSPNCVPGRSAARSTGRPSTFPRLDRDTQWSLNSRSSRQTRRWVSSSSRTQSSTLQCSTSPPAAGAG
jgi:hypothetical protein